MKAALITEDQIKAIEDALANSKPISQYSFDFDNHLKALAIVKSLKVQKPVAWLDEEMDSAYSANETDVCGTDGFLPLYAGEQP